MRTRKWAVILASVFAILLVSCRSAPVYNISDASIASDKSNLSLEDVSKAIIRAGGGLGWQIQEDKPGHMVGTLYLRTHVAVVDINYTTKSYSITYKDSKNLDYDGTNIHTNYNGWVQNLNKAINVQLRLL